MRLDLKSTCPGLTTEIVLIQYLAGVEGLPLHQVHAGVVPQDGVLHVPLHHAHPRHQYLGAGIVCCSSREWRQGIFLVQLLFDGKCWDWVYHVGVRYTIHVQIRYTMQPWRQPLLF